MESIYTILVCKRCKKTTILLTEDVIDTRKSNKYIACAHCGCKNFKEEKATNNAKECMHSVHYKRIKGALRQVN